MKRGAKVLTFLGVVVLVVAVAMFFRGRQYLNTLQ